MPSAPWTLVLSVVLALPTLPAGSLFSTKRRDYDSNGASSLGNANHRRGRVAVSILFLRVNADVFTHKWWEGSFSRRVVLWPPRAILTYLQRPWGSLSRRSRKRRRTRGGTLAGPEDAAGAGGCKYSTRNVAQNKHHQSPPPAALPLSRSPGQALKKGATTQPPGAHVDHPSALLSGTTRQMLGGPSSLSLPPTRLLLRTFFLPLTGKPREVVSSAASRARNATKDPDLHSTQGGQPAGQPDDPARTADGQQARASTPSLAALNPAIEAAVARGEVGVGVACFAVWIWRQWKRMPLSLASLKRSPFGLPCRSTGRPFPSSKGGLLLEEQTANQAGSSRQERRCSVRRHAAADKPCVAARSNRVCVSVVADLRAHWLAGRIWMDAFSLKNVDVLVSCAAQEGENTTPTPLVRFLGSPKDDDHGSVTPGPVGMRR
ncbi:hypothetical protein GGTG_03093 [Gaeumannomyces tritici R3-111a-1]|uniref:Uncharacterized protein n=1 Tax=Gaeumannomyces tritici (strain R3-111a-1) TaxID=644352 RepID=J3NP87_GAET3|nr:hypothetical protein GGTG_03093 [Gaeumannomyces tritici R3-111a-1]EJT77990.1 hypothetical protein GGTG_03093 [Gaeumannomyces tritici R3-111a-1]